MSEQGKSPRTPQAEQRRREHRQSRQDAKDLDATLDVLEQYSRDLDEALSLLADWYEQHWWDAEGEYVAQTMELLSRLGVREDET